MIDARFYTEGKLSDLKFGLGQVRQQLHEYNSTSTLLWCSVAQLVAQPFQACVGWSTRSFLPRL